MTNRDNIINSIKELKSSVLSNGTLTLFGSQARNDANMDSDWDVSIKLTQ